MPAREKASCFRACVRPLARLKGDTVVVMGIRDRTYIVAYLDPSRSEPGGKGAVIEGVYKTRYALKTRVEIIPFPTKAELEKMLRLTRDSFPDDQCNTFIAVMRASPVRTLSDRELRAVAGTYRHMIRAGVYTQ